ncbi:MAG: hypothetical protein ABEJ57_06865 [Halobacteriaceae archaeon]
MDDGSGDRVLATLKPAVPPAMGAMAGFVAITSIGAAHVGALSDSAGSTTVPPWLTFLTGGGIVAGSFLFTALLTDHEAIRMVNTASLRLPSPTRIWRVLRPLLQVGSVGALVVVVAVGLVGPRTPTTNLTILVVWAGWWAGYTASVYLVGNTWPVLNPWRAIATAVPGGRWWDLPDDIGAWPSVVGLLALVFVEVVTPAAADPRLLTGLILAYTAVTVIGAVGVGPTVWFERIDSIARVFRLYGAIAPIQHTANGLRVRLPTTPLTDADTPPTGETRFVIAVLWATTFDGLVSTPAWETAISPLVTAGVPALLVYAVGMVAGFGLFLYAYRLAARRARQAADSYVDPTAIGAWLIPSLLPIAAGYHLAHFLGYFVSLSPALLGAVGAPVTGPRTVTVLVLPGWWPVLQLGVVLLGHLLAVWVAHAIALDLFPGRLRAIRSQAPFVVAMVLYTVTSMWIIVQPAGPPPYV